MASIPGTEQNVHPRDLSISRFTYDLPDSRIARYPLPDRDASKLLVYRDGNISEDHYRNIASLLPEGALMVFNDTKVIEARLLFRKETGGQVEIFCLEPQDAEPSGAMMQEGSATWKCLVGGAGKWKQGALAREWTEGQKPLRLEAEKVGVVPDGFLVRFSWKPEDLSFAEVLHRAGLVPLPPYLQRESEAMDTERYQTVYAKYEGSVAAPTAGLHFTRHTLDALRARGITTDFVTLHVGAGTFKPVKAEKMEEHVMHAEWIDVTRAFVEELSGAAGPVIPVGTTALRTLESLYWMGVKVMHSKARRLEDLAVNQWEPYDDASSPLPDRKEALTVLAAWLQRHGMPRLVTQTQLLIAPGYRPRVAEALVTNFHQPGSTLLLLVAALIGEDWKKVYQYALDHDFRFLSYGDGSLVWF